MSTTGKTWIDSMSPQGHGCGRCHAMQSGPESAIATVLSEEEQLHRGSAAKRWGATKLFPTHRRSRSRWSSWLARGADRAFAAAAPAGPAAPVRLPNLDGSVCRDWSGYRQMQGHPIRKHTWRPASASCAWVTASRIPPTSDCMASAARPWASTVC